MMRILTAADYRVMPWKNGGGTSTEIHIQPPGASWDDFEWRVGIADIAQSGPFSSFPGIDRSIMLLECDGHSGMRLTIDGRDVELPLHRFVAFAGEATTYGALRGTPVRDFNVMSRRNAIAHRCAGERLAASDARDIAVARWNFVFVADGHASITASSTTLRVPRGASLIVENEPLRIEAMEEGCRIVVAAFENASTGGSIGEDAVIRDGPAQGR